MTADLGDRRPAAPSQLTKWLQQHWLLSEPWVHYVYRYPLVWLLAAFIAGLQLGTFIDDRRLPWLAGGMVMLLLVSLVAQRRQRPLLAGGAALTLAMLFAATYAHVFRPAHDDALAHGASRESQPIAVRAVIDTAAVWRPNASHREEDPASHAWLTQWEVHCLAVRDAGNWQPIDAISTLTAEGRIYDFLPGDVIEVFGSYRSLPPPSNPGAFDFSEYSRQQSKFVHLTADNQQQIKLLKHGPKHLWGRLRGQAIRAIDRTLYRWVTYDQAPLAAALVFGQRAQVDWENQQALMATGTLHLLAISGMHVGILAAVIVLICSLFSARSRTEFIAIAIICSMYAALAGGKPPVLRAVVLVGLFAVARVWGRRTRLANFLSLAAIILLLIQITNLGNVGVHLSFLAVGSIGVFAIRRGAGSPRRSALQTVLEESYPGWYRRWLLLTRSSRAAFKLSFWVWLMTCPLIWMHFHVVAPIAIPLNVLIAVPLVVSLLGGLITGVLGWLPPLGWIAGQLTGSSLAAITWMVSVGKAVPLSHLWLPAPPVWWIGSFYGITVLWLALFGRARRGLLAVLLLAWLGTGVALFSVGPRGYLTGVRGGSAATNATGLAALRCTFLDVGHGTSAIIELPSGQVWLYDAGHLGAAERSHQEIATALWELPTARIDKLLISHADADHYNATLGLLERFNIATVVSTERFWRSSAAGVVEIRSALDAQGIERTAWDAAAGGQAGGVNWQVLHPHDALAAESDNASSLCLLLEYAGKRLLLPGDLEGNGMLNLVALPERPCHALMAPHHGSLSHDPSPLLAWCQPEVVVISGNHRAVRPRVLQQYAQSGALLGVTFRDGAIQIRISADGELSSWHWQAGEWSPLGS